MAYTPTILAGPPGGTSTAAAGASSNTAIIVGVCQDSGANQRGCYWDNAGNHLLLNLAGGAAAEAVGCSADASRIVGAAADSGAVLRPVVWTDFTSAPAVLPDLGFGGGANAISYDNSTIVGSVTDSSGFSQACAWRGGPSWALTVLTGLGGSNSQAFAVSIDGSTIVGSSQVPAGLEPIHAAKWTGGAPWSAAIDLGLIAGGLSAIAYGCSGNASKIVGQTTDAAGFDAAIWTLNGPDVLQVPPGATHSVFSRGIDLSGTYIGGSAVFGITGDQPVLWSNGVPQVLGLPDGFTGASVLGIGPDAATLFGITTAPTISAIAWIGPPPPVVNQQFLVCGNDWSIAPTQGVLYGLDHLVGQPVVGLADGVPIGPLTVQSDGSVILPFPASLVTLGRGYTVQLQTPYLDIGNPTVQGRRKDISAATVRVDASAAPMVGSNQPDGGSFTPTQIGPAWTNLQPSVTQDPQQFPGTYVNPSGQTVTLLFSGDFRANLQPGWDERGQLAVQQTLPVPLAVNALIPEALMGDLPEQGISPPPQGRGEAQGPGLWMITSRSGR